MQLIFALAARVISLYSTLCVIRIFISWIPQLNWSPIGQFFAAICDPFLKLFSKIPLRIGGLDFSPMIGFAILSLLSSVFANIARTGRLHLGGILANLVLISWQLISSLALFFLIALIVRLIVMIFSKNSEYYTSPWSQFDSSISPAVFKMTSIFSRGKSLKYKTALILCIIELILIEGAGSLGFGYLAHFLSNLPI